MDTPECKIPICGCHFAAKRRKIVSSIKLCYDTVMSTNVSVKKLNREVGALRGEVRRIRSLFLEVVADSEGEYRPAFVKKIISREQERPRFRSMSRVAFLKHVRGK